MSCVLSVMSGTRPIDIMWVCHASYTVNWLIKACLWVTKHVPKDVFGVQDITWTSKLFSTGGT